MRDASVRLQLERLCRLLLLQNVAVDGLGGHVGCAPRAKMVLDMLQMRPELWAVFATQSIIRLQSVKQFMHLYPLLLRTHERSLANLVGPHLLELPPEEFFGLLRVRFTCAFAVLLSAQEVCAVVVPAALVSKNSPISPAFHFDVKSSRRPEAGIG
jgi:hypothetical protein